VLEAIRWAGAAGAGILLVAIGLLWAAHRRRPERERVLDGPAATLLGVSYAASLLSGASLVGDLAGQEAEFRWYAAPLLGVSVATGLGFVARAHRAWRRA
jgi:hypothetical protein